MHAHCLEARYVSGLGCVINSGRGQLVFASFHVWILCSDLSSDMMFCRVRAVYEATSNVSLLSEAVPLLVQEHTYWTTGRLSHCALTRVLLQVTQLGWPWSS
jgi:hypothetical protein